MAHHPIRRETPSNFKSTITFFQNVHDSCIFANKLKNKKTINNTIIINLIKGYVICISPDHIITFQQLALFI